MKSYGRIDKFWDDAKFRALIGDTLRMAKERGVPLAVHQDDDGNIVVSRARDDYSFMYACVAVAHRNESTGECRTALVGAMPYEFYTIEQMIPIARDALARGIFEYDASGSYQTVQKRLRDAAECAERMARMRGEPFIAGMTDRGITVAPMSERHRFVEQAACVFTEHAAWSLPDAITSWSATLDMQHKARHSEITFASDLRSAMIEDPARRIHHAMIRVRNRRNEAAREAQRAGNQVGSDPTGES